MGLLNKFSGVGSQKKNVSKQVVVNIWLDSLDELFSDFDPRSYLKRTLSDDFITQIRRVVADQVGEKMILQLQLPAEIRNEQDEDVIAGRLQNYFTEKHGQLLKKRKNGIRNAVFLMLLGLLLMVISSYIVFLNSAEYYPNLLLVLFEPGGWFCMWTGLDRLLDHSLKQRKELNFYSRMSATHFQFKTI
jgi:hypothetical protein